MMTLAEIYQDCLHADEGWEHEAILYIGSESYDAPTITVLQGLDRLGWRIYTLKSNINSWWCQRIVPDPANIQFDLVLSNLHWGTRWDWYAAHDLWDYPLVLIDGDDNGRFIWSVKHMGYSLKYSDKPPRYFLSQLIQPHRWMVPLGDYKPDVLFTSQHNGSDAHGHYLPFGLHKEYLVQDEKVWDKSGAKWDFSVIAGPGPKRRKLTNFAKQGNLPGRVFAGKVYGDWLAPHEIQWAIRNDDNIHSWHRWRWFPAYWARLLTSFALIYPGVYDHAHWDAKRPWEALGAGCLLIAEEPPIDVSGFDWRELAVTYERLEDLPALCQDILDNRVAYDEVRRSNAERARKYLGPEAMARYFLSKVREECDGDE